MTLETLLSRLEELRQLDPQQQLFGANTHHYQLAPPLPETEVAAFEAELDLQLPGEYRQFLVAAGNGGAGPVYGLKPLVAWRLESFGRSADPSRPFPLTAEWSPDGGNLPEGASPYDGCLELAEIGCGYFYFLVVKGARAGEVWQDYTAGDGTISPTGKSFFAWYAEWLEDSLAERAYESLKPALKSGQRSPLLDAQLGRIEAQSQASPDWAVGHLRRAAVHTYRKEFAEAEAALARAVELEPRLELDAALERVTLLWCQDRLADLVELASRVLGGDNFHFAIFKELHQVRCIALGHLGRHDEALAAAAARVEFDPANLSAWLDHARLQASDGDRPAAEATIRRAAESNCGDGDPAALAAQGFGALANLLARHGRADDAAYFNALAAPN